MCLAGGLPQQVSPPRPALAPSLVFPCINLFLLPTAGVLATGEVYSKTTKAWSPLPDMPGARNGCRSVTLGDWIYVVGGWTPSEVVSKTVWRFHPKTRKWEELPDMLEERAFGTVIPIDLARF